jgi:hypothetical protein
MDTWILELAKLLYIDFFRLEKFSDNTIGKFKNIINEKNKVKTEGESPDSNKSRHKNWKTKIITIKSTKKHDLETSDSLKDKLILDEFDKIMNKEIPGYKELNYDRITPSLIMKFSEGFEKLINYSEVQSVSQDSDKPQVLRCIKNAYENFVKRIVGINNFWEIEGVLKRCLELSSHKYSLQPEKDEDSGSRRIVKSYNILIDDYKVLAEKRVKIEKDAAELKSKMQTEIDMYSKRKKEEIKKMKAIIKQLKSKLEQVSTSEVSNEKYLRLKEKFKLLLSENDQLNSLAYKLKDQVEDLNRKNNRSNFLMYLCMKEGYPVARIYKEEVKPIDSHRFDLLTPSKFKKSIIKLNEDMGKPNRGRSQENRNTNNCNQKVPDPIPEDIFDDSQSEIIEDSNIYATNRTIGLNGSYDPIITGAPAEQNKPFQVPSLNFDKLDEYNKAVKNAKKNKHNEKMLMKQGEYKESDELESLIYSN